MQEKFTISRYHEMLDTISCKRSLPSQGTTRCWIQYHAREVYHLKVPRDVGYNVMQEKFTISRYHEMLDTISCKRSLPSQGTTRCWIQYHAREVYHLKVPRDVGYNVMQEKFTISRYHEMLDTISCKRSLPSQGTTRCWIQCHAREVYHLKVPRDVGYNVMQEKFTISRYHEMLDTISCKRSLPSQGTTRCWIQCHAREVYHLKVPRDVGYNVMQEKFTISRYHEMLDTMSCKRSLPSQGTTRCWIQWIHAREVYHLKVPRDVGYNVMQEKFTISRYHEMLDTMSCKRSLPSQGTTRCWIQCHAREVYHLKVPRDVGYNVMQEKFTISRYHEMLDTMSCKRSLPSQGTTRCWIQYHAREVYHLKVPRDVGYNVMQEKFTISRYHEMLDTMSCKRSLPSQGTTRCWIQYHAREVYHLKVPRDVGYNVMQEKFTISRYEMLDTMSCKRCWIPSQWWHMQEKFTISRYHEMLDTMIMQEKFTISRYHEMLDTMSCKRSLPSQGTTRCWIQCHAREVYHLKVPRDVGYNHAREVYHTHAREVYHLKDVLDTISCKRSLPSQGTTRCWIQCHAREVYHLKVPRDVGYNIMQEKFTISRYHEMLDTMSCKRSLPSQGTTRCWIQCHAREVYHLKVPRDVGYNIMQEKFTISRYHEMLDTMSCKRSLPSQGTTRCWIQCHAREVYHLKVPRDVGYNIMQEKFTISRYHEMLDTISCKRSLPSQGTTRCWIQCHAREVYHLKVPRDVGYNVMQEKFTISRYHEMLDTMSCKRSLPSQGTTRCWIQCHAREVYHLKVPRDVGYNIMQEKFTISRYHEMLDTMSCKRSLPSQGTTRCWIQCHAREVYHLKVPRDVGYNVMQEKFTISRYHEMLDTMSCKRSLPSQGTTRCWIQCHAREVYHLKVPRDVGYNVMQEKFTISRYHEMLGYMHAREVYHLKVPRDVGYNVMQEKFTISRYHEMLDTMSCKRSLPSQGTTRCWIQYHAREVYHLKVPRDVGYNIMQEKFTISRYHEMLDTMSCKRSLPSQGTTRCWIQYHAREVYHLKVPRDDTMSCKRSLPSQGTTRCWIQCHAREVYHLKVPRDVGYNIMQEKFTISRYHEMLDTMSCKRSLPSQGTTRCWIQCHAREVYHLKVPRDVGYISRKFTTRYHEMLDTISCKRSLPSQGTTRCWIQCHAREVYHLKVPRDVGYNIMQEKFTISRYHEMLDTMSCKRSLPSQGTTRCWIQCHAREVYHLKVPRDVVQYHAREVYHLKVPRDVGYNVMQEKFTISRYHEMLDTMSCKRSLPSQGTTRCWIQCHAREVYHLKVPRDVGYNVMQEKFTISRYHEMLDTMSCKRSLPSQGTTRCWIQCHAREVYHLKVPRDVGYNVMQEKFTISRYHEMLDTMSCKRSLPSQGTTRCWIQYHAREVYHLKVPRDVDTIQCHAREVYHLKVPRDVGYNVMQEKFTISRYHEMLDTISCKRSLPSQGTTRCWIRDVGYNVMQEKFTISRYHEMLDTMSCKRSLPSQGTTRCWIQYHAREVYHLKVPRDVGYNVMQEKFTISRYHEMLDTMSCKRSLPSQGTTRCWIQCHAREVYHLKVPRDVGHAREVYHLKVQYVMQEKFTISRYHEMLDTISCKRSLPSQGTTRCWIQYHAREVYHLKVPRDVGYNIMQEKFTISRYHEMLDTISCKRSLPSQEKFTKVPRDVGYNIMQEKFTISRYHEMLDTISCKRSLPSQGTTRCWIQYHAREVYHLKVPRDVGYNVMQEKFTISRYHEMLDTMSCKRSLPSQGTTRCWIQYHAREVYHLKVPRGVGYNIMQEKFTISRYHEMLDTMSCKRSLPSQGTTRCWIQYHAREVYHLKVPRDVGYNIMQEKFTISRYHEMLDTMSCKRSLPSQGTTRCWIQYHAREVYHLKVPRDVGYNVMQEKFTISRYHEMLDTMSCKRSLPSQGTTRCWIQYHAREVYHLKVPRDVGYNVMQEKFTISRYHEMLDTMSCKRSLPSQGTTRCWIQCHAREVYHLKVPRDDTISCKRSLPSQGTTRCWIQCHQGTTRCWIQCHAREVYHLKVPRDVGYNVMQEKFTISRYHEMLDTISCKRSLPSQGTTRCWIQCHAREVYHLKVPRDVGYNVMQEKFTISRYHEMLDTISCKRSLPSQGTTRCWIQCHAREVYHLKVPRDEIQCHAREVYHLKVPRDVGTISCKRSLPSQGTTRCWIQCHAREVYHLKVPRDVGYNVMQEKFTISRYHEMLDTISCKRSLPSQGTTRCWIQCHAREVYHLKVPRDVGYNVMQEKFTISRYHEMLDTMSCKRSLPSQGTTRCCWIPRDVGYNIMQEKFTISRYHEMLDTMSCKRSLPSQGTTRCWIQYHAREVYHLKVPRDVGYNVMQEKFTISRYHEMLDTMSCKRSLPSQGTTRCWVQYHAREVYHLKVPRDVGYNVMQEKFTISRYHEMLGTISCKRSLPSQGTTRCWIQYHAREVYHLKVPRDVGYNVMQEKFTISRYHEMLDTMSCKRSLPSQGTTRCWIQCHAREVYHLKVPRDVGYNVMQEKFTISRYHEMLDTMSCKRSLPSQGTTRCWIQCHAREVYHLKVPRDVGYNVMQEKFTISRYHEMLDTMSCKRSLPSQGTTRCWVQYHAREVYHLKVPRDVGYNIMQEKFTISRYHEMLDTISCKRSLPSQGTTRCWIQYHAEVYHLKVPRDVGYNIMQEKFTISRYHEMLDTISCKRSLPSQGTTRCWIQCHAREVYHLKVPRDVGYNVMQEKFTISRYHEMLDTMSCKRSLPSQGTTRCWIQCHAREVYHLKVPRDVGYNIMQEKFTISRYHEMLDTISCKRSLPSQGTTRCWIQYHAREVYHLKVPRDVRYNVMQEKFTISRYHEMLGTISCKRSLPSQGTTRCWIQCHAREVYHLKVPRDVGYNIMQEKFTISRYHEMLDTISCKRSLPSQGTTRCWIQCHAREVYHLKVPRDVGYNVMQEKFTISRYHEMLDTMTCKRSLPSQGTTRCWIQCHAREVYHLKVPRDVGYNSCKRSLPSQGTTRCWIQYHAREVYHLKVPRGVGYNIMQ